MVISKSFSSSLRSSLCLMVLAVAGLAQAAPASVETPRVAAHAATEAARLAQAGAEIERIAQAEPTGAGFAAAPLRLQVEAPPPPASQSSLPTWFLLFGGLIGAGFVTALRQR